MFNDDRDECDAPPPVLVGEAAAVITTAADNSVAEEGVTPIRTPKELFLQVYGLQKLGITTIAKWMHAVGF